MIADAERADRRQEVRLAARAWRRAGLIDDRALQLIFDEYPDDRARVGPAFRVLLFFFGVVAVVSLFTVFAVSEFPIGLLLAATAIGSLAATDVQVQRFRRAQSGSEEATAILAVFFTIATVGWFLDGSGGDFDWRLLCGVAALASFFGAWRWGVPFLGAAAAASGFLMLVWWAGARVSWIVLAATLVLPLLRGSVSPSLAPSHRRSCDAALVTTLLAVYFAVHLGSFDARLLERELWGTINEVPAWLPRWFFVLATGAVPGIVLLAGILRKRPILLRSGLVFAVASLVTLRFYVHVAPLWVVLTVSGGVAIALAMLVHRYLAGGKEKERHGFTAEPLFERLDAATALEVGLTASLAPEARGGTEDSRFKGRGGEFGGGGASGTY